MSLSSSLNLVSFVFYLSLVLYILIKNPKPLPSRLCAAFVGCFAFWTFTRLFIYNPHVSRSVAGLFANIGSLGWIGCSSFFLWFALVFSGKKKILEKTYFYMFLFGIPLVLISLQWSGLIIVDFTKEAFGWRPIVGKSVWSFIFFGYAISFMIAGLFLIFDVMRKSHGKRAALKRKQAQIIFSSTLIPLLASAFTDILLPMMNIYRLPHLTGFYGLVWASGLVYAMARYKFLAIIPTASIDDIKDVLFNISEAVRRAVTLRQLLEIIQQQVDRLMDAKNFYVALVYDKEKALYTFPFIVDVNPEELEEPGTPVQLKNSFTDYVCRTEKPMLADKKKYDDLFVREDIQLIGKKPLSWIGVPLKTPGDEVIGVVVMQSYTDESAYSDSDMHVLSIISNTIAGAIKYKQAEEALRESEEKYRALIDNIQDGVFLIYKRKLEFTNDAFARMVGCHVEELLGKDFKDFISPGDRELVESRYEKRLRGEDVPAEYEFRMLHKNGTDVYVNMHVGLMSYKDGTASMGTLKDVTGRISVEKEKRELEEKLARSEKMEAIGRLAGGVAHDLNNVLSAIVSYPDLLLMKLPQDSPLRKSIITIKQSGQRAAAIVQDLLTLARRGVTITKTENLNQVVADYLGSPEFEKLVKSHSQVHFKTQLRRDLQNIKGSAIHLSKTVMNLVANAAEAMPSGGEVLISTENRNFGRPIKGYYHAIEKGQYAVLTVSDTGVGIAPEDLGKIFDPFYTKKVMERTGTGLGMSVIWGTVEDHKGFIDVSSTQGKGTTFKLYFPVTVEKNSNFEAANIPINKYMGRGEKILVVDDERDQGEIASVLLTELGYSVHTVSSGEEAVDYIKTNTADLLLLDMLMAPGIDGLDTYKQILKIHPGMKAIITSGFSESDRVKQALKLGAGMYVKKPYTMEKIGLAVSRELGHDLDATKKFQPVEIIDRGQGRDNRD
jgi:PAS domain S-box-containing protein